jgi:hypothetical protein
MGRLRREYLVKQLSALEARVRMLKGERLNFDEESRNLYAHHRVSRFVTAIR